MCLELANEVVFSQMVLMDDSFEEAVHDATFLRDIVSVPFPSILGYHEKIDSFEYH